MSKHSHGNLNRLYDAIAEDFAMQIGLSLLEEREEGIELFRVEVIQVRKIKEIFKEEGIDLIELTSK